MSATFIGKIKVVRKELKHSIYYENFNRKMEGIYKTFIFKIKSHPANNVENLLNVFC